MSSYDSIVIPSIKPDWLLLCTPLIAAVCSVIVWYFLVEAYRQKTAPAVVRLATLSFGWASCALFVIGIAFLATGPAVTVQIAVPSALQQALEQQSNLRDVTVSTDSEFQDSLSYAATDANGVDVHGYLVAIKPQEYVIVPSRG